LLFKKVEVASIIVAIQSLFSAGLAVKLGVGTGYVVVPSDDIDAEKMISVL
jgi:hypothetical protein